MSLNSLQNYDKSLIQPNICFDFTKKSSVKVYAESSKKAGTVVVSAFLVIIDIAYFQAAPVAQRWSPIFLV